MKKVLSGLAVIAIMVLAALFAWGEGLGSLEVGPPRSSVEMLDVAEPPAEEAEPEGPAEFEPAGEYAEMLSQLPIKGRAPMTDYEREEFGQAWSDDVSVEGGRNGCDTRNDILRRDLDGPQIRDGTFGCLVESGTLTDPYTGETIDFERGDGQVEIDHVVALGDAWAKGAQQLDEDTRRDFANDPVNLLAVGTSVNRQKGAGDAATWQPPQRSFRCEYAQRQIEVKHMYQLWVTEAEHEALGRELGRCTDQH